MYPLHLEQQYEKLFEKTFMALAGMLSRSLAGRLGKAVSAAASTRTDAPDDDIFQFLEELRKEYGDWIDKDILESQVSRNFHLIDAWSRDKTLEAVTDLVTRLNTPQPPGITGRPTPPGLSGERWLTTVNLLSGENGMTSAMRDRVIKQNVGLIGSLAQEHFEDVTRIIGDGLTGGKSLKSIVNDIEETTGVNRNRAKFWARDQSSKFFGEVTKQRMSDAGIPGYVWRNVGDDRVRDAHEDAEGRYFEWARPGVTNSRGNLVHPGEDFNCRCWPEPAFGPEYADRDKNKIKDPLEYMKRPEAEPETGEFKPVGSAKEGEAYARKMGMASKADYSRLSKETVNRVNRVLYDLKERYPFLRPVEISETRRKAAAMGSWRRLLLNKREFFTKAQDALLDERNYRAMMEDIYKTVMKNAEGIMKGADEGLKKITAREIEKMKYMMQFNRYSSLVPGKEYESVIYHEFGHIISDQLYGMLNGVKAGPLAPGPLREAFLSEWKEIFLKLHKTKDIFKISHYAMKSESECFAECFSLYHMDGPSLPVYVRDAIRKYFDNFLVF